MKQKTTITLGTPLSKSTAIHNLDETLANRRRAVSEPCVLAELILEAKRRKLDLEFVGFVGAGKEQAVIPVAKVKASLVVIFETLAREMGE